MEITVYSRTNCQPCKATKRKLGAAGLRFKEILTDENEEAAEFLRNAGYKETPVVRTSEGDEWHGYRPDLIEALADRVFSS